MKPTILVITLLFLTVTIGFLMGCGGKTVIVPAQPTPPAQPTASQSITVLNVPQWFSNPPADDEEYLYVAASANATSLQRAINRAEEQARSKMALKIEANVQTMVKNFGSEVGEGENTEVTALYEEVSKSVARQTLRGLSTRETLQTKEGAVFTAYVLMELPKHVQNAAAVDAIKQQQILYNRFRASQSFQEMEAEMEKLDERQQKQSGVTP